MKKDIAIIGMSCIFPDALNIREYWTNILEKKNSITEVPASRWNIDDYYDPNPRAPEKTYCKMGGFIPDFDFDPISYGIPPNTLESIDVTQLLALKCAQVALKDAGYLNAPQSLRDKTSVIIGVTGGFMLNTPLLSRLQYPVWKKVLKSCALKDNEIEKIIEKIKSAYVKWTEDSFPGVLPNVTAGRVSNRLNLGGMNCTVDAACASSLAAMGVAINELRTKRCDLALTGGIDSNNSEFAYMAFSKTPALSTDKKSAPFDADTKGILLGEGAAIVVLKRLEDALRDKDKIYSLIKGIGASSDGKNNSIYAPSSEGQLKAYRRALQDANLTPKDIDLVEAHGTGTPAGDPVEIEGLNRLFKKDEIGSKRIAIGSVKSQIGHTKSAAGVAGLIKTALALHHKILPPTINIKKPNPKFRESSLYPNTETRPWIKDSSEAIRRAGVSSFGFGGSNYHVILEEYNTEWKQKYKLHSLAREIILYAPTREELIRECQNAIQEQKSNPGDDAFFRLLKRSETDHIPKKYHRVGLIAENKNEASELLNQFLNAVKNVRENDDYEDIESGIFYKKEGRDVKGKTVVIFPGQESQFVNMGKQLTVNFPELRQFLFEFDEIRLKYGLEKISEIIYPFPHDEKNEKINLMENSQSALAFFNAGLYKLLYRAGLRPDFLAGHNSGELTALWASRALKDYDYIKLTLDRAQAMSLPGAYRDDGDGMMAVIGDIGNIVDMLKDFSNVWIASYNSSKHIILTGAKENLRKIKGILEKINCICNMLAVSEAFHSPSVKHVSKSLENALDHFQCEKPSIPVYSNLTSESYPDSIKTIKEYLAKQIISPVLFKQEIENIYDQGGYYFIECGPKNILTRLINDILKDKPHETIAVDTGKINSYRDLVMANIRLRVIGFSLKNIDPYIKNPENEKSDASTFSIRLNGSNYVSRQTKDEFAKALNDDFSLLGGLSDNKVDFYNTKRKGEENMENENHIEYSPDHFNQTPIERMINELHKQQNEVTKIHEEYLKNQAEYVRTIANLIKTACASSPTDAVKQPSLSPNSIIISEGETARQQPVIVQGSVKQKEKTKEETLKNVTIEIKDHSKAIKEQEQIKITETGNSMFDQIKEMVLNIVSEKTGYPVQMIDIDMDIETDLGIDSIKRVEIMSSLQQLYPDLNFELGDVAGLKTIKTIIEFIVKILSAQKKN